jgi:hypothetical protein
VFTDVVIEDL